MLDRKQACDWKREWFEVEGDQIAMWFDSEGGGRQEELGYRKGGLRKISLNDFQGNEVREGLITGRSIFTVGGLLTSFLPGFAGAGEINDVGVKTLREKTKARGASVELRTGASVWTIFTSFHVPVLRSWVELPRVIFPASLHVYLFAQQKSLLLQ